MAIQLNDSAIKVLSQSHDYNKEIFLLGKAIELDSNYVGAYSNLASAQAMQKHFEDALQTSLKILTLKIEMLAQYYTMVGMLYDVKRDTVSSLKYYNKALTHYDNELNALNKSDRKYDMLLANKAITLILSGVQWQKGNEILKELNARQKGWSVTFYYREDIDKTKWEIIDEVFNGQGHSKTHLIDSPTQLR